MIYFFFFEKLQKESHFQMAAIVRVEPIKPKPRASAREMLYQGLNTTWTMGFTSANLSQEGITD